MGAVLLQLHLGVERRPNDAGLIQALGRNHGGTDMQLFGETVKALSAAAAEDEEARVAGRTGIGQRGQLIGRADPRKKRGVCR